MTGSLRQGNRNMVALVAASGLVLGGASAFAQPARADTTAASTAKASNLKPAKDKHASDKLGQTDRATLQRRKAAHYKKTTAMFVAKKGQIGALKRELTALGAEIRRSYDKVGYVRVDMPTGKVLKASALDRVSAVDLRRMEKVPNPTPRQTRATSEALVGDPNGPNSSTPDANPYMPTRETGSVAFKRAHPTWDGRGVTIGVLDTGVDLDHPALAETTTGETKIVDWVTATDPITDGDPSWLNMAFQYDVTDGTFVYNPNPSVSLTYTAPYNGQFRFARLAEQPAFAEGFEGDLNRDGDATDRFGVLWDTNTDQIYVDTDSDLDFTDEDSTAMAPYRVNHDVRYLGIDNPATEIKERVPFTVEYRKNVQYQGNTYQFVNIGLVAGEHGSHVAGITAANGLFGGAMDGQAPGAKLVSSRACLFAAGCSNVALTEGMADLVINRGVDVVNMSIGGLPALNDGDNARALLYNSLIEQYGVQLFISAGNEGSGVNTIGDPAVATDVVAAAAEVSKATWKANYGSVVTARRAMFTFSSRGPREDGGFKPNVSAPGSAISTIPTWMPGGPVPEAGYDLPPGYAMLNGTSMSSPQSAGAAALLVSAAKATGRGFTPAQLRRAIYSATTPIHGERVTAQGLGMVNVPGAWNVLAKNPTKRVYQSSAPICSVVNQIIGRTTGTGVYNRCSPSDGGARLNKANTYQVTVVRHGGVAGPRRHKISWFGNDGTWSGPSSVVLRRGTAVTFSVTARPTTRSVHAAIMKLDDPGTAGLDYQVMNVVVLGNGLGAKHGFGRHVQTTVERNRAKSYFVVVPEGAKTLTARLKGIASSSQVRFLAFHPFGVGVEDNSSLSCYTNRPNNGCDPFVRSYSDPTPGIWEFTVEARRTSPYLVNPLTLDIALQGVTVTPATQTLASVTQGVPAPVSWTVTNNYNSTPVEFQGGSLGSAKSANYSIDQGEQQTYTVDVPAGSDRLDVSILGGPNDDLDLYVDGPNGESFLSADGDADESVSVDNPAAGTWTVTVDGFDVPGGTTTYDYLDVFFSSALGSLDVTTPSTTLGAGQTVAVDGVLTAQQAPASGRQLFGQLTVVTPDGVQLGVGKVIVGTVT